METYKIGDFVTNVNTGRQFEIESVEKDRIIVVTSKLLGELSFKFNQMVGHKVVRQIQVCGKHTVNDKL